MNNRVTAKLKASSFIKDYLVLVAIVTLVVITIIIEPKFISSANINNIIRQFGPLSFVALGMTFVIIGGFIDLSVAGIMSLVAVLTYSLIDVIGPVPALIAGLLLGAVMGYLNSVIIISCGALSSAEALFITFGMSTVYGALALISCGGVTNHMSRLTADISIYKAIGQGRLGFIPISFAIFLVCLMLLWGFQSKTYMGRSIFLTGGNKTAAELTGIPVKRSIRLIYTISGLLTAVGAIVLLSRVTTASPVLGKNFETNAILAVVVGGTTLKGGQGSVMRTVLGVALVTLLSNCMNLLGISTYMQTVLQGTILVIAIWLDNRK